MRYPVEVAVNGRRVDFLEGLNTRLRDGDRVLFSPRALFVV
ncbi:MAG: MoaD/ThiS family protein [Thermoproteota archaeon]